MPKINKKFEKILIRDLKFISNTNRTCDALFIHITELRYISRFLARHMFQVKKEFFKTFCVPIGI